MGMIFEYVPISPSEFDQLRANRDFVEDFVFELLEERGSDIDKAWHGIHFLLNGDGVGGEFPLSFVMNGGEALTEHELPLIRILSAGEVKQIAQALADVEPGELHERFDANALAANDIYPDNWNDGDDIASYLSENYAQLRKDFQKAASHGQAMITSLG